MLLNNFDILKKLTKIQCGHKIIKYIFEFFKEIIVIFVSIFDTYY